MKYSILFIIFLILCITPAVALPTPNEWRVFAADHQGSLSKEEIDAFISPLITYNLSKGLIVVVVDKDGYAWYPYGVADALTDRPLDNTSLFDIGSVSKVMTGILMADAEIRGIYNISAPADTWLSGKYRLPAYEGMTISGRDLATHRSGLQTVPDTFFQVNPDSSSEDQMEEAMLQYQTMTADEVYQWLSGQELLSPPGYQYIYSNLGAAIAGDTVARAEEIPYPELFGLRIANPLGLSGTGATWTLEDLDQRATGYRAYSYPTSVANIIRFNEFWTAAGGIHSNADDMAVFLAAVMGLLDTPLDNAIAQSQAPLAVTATGPPLLEQGLFWDILHNRDGTTILKKAGETNAHQAAIAFNPDLKAGVVILSNTASIGGIHVEEQAIALLERIKVKKKNEEMGVKNVSPPVLTP